MLQRLRMIPILNDTIRSLVDCPVVRSREIDMDHRMLIVLGLAVIDGDRDILTGVIEIHHGRQRNQ